MYDRTEEIIGYKKELSYSDTSNGTFVKIGGTFEFDFPQAELGKAEITNDDTPDRMKDYIPGLYEPGTLAFKYRYGKTQYATIAGIHLLATVETTVASATKYWKVKLLDGSIAAFRGFITKHGVAGLNMEDGVDVEGEMQVLGKVTFTPGA